MPPDHAAAYWWIKQRVKARACKLRTGDRLLALMLADHVNTRTGEAWPSRETLCAETGLGHTAVTNGLARLCDGPDPLFARRWIPGRRTPTYTVVRNPETFSAAREAKGSATRSLTLVGGREGAATRSLTLAGEAGDTRPPDGRQGSATRSAGVRHAVTIRLENLRENSETPPPPLQGGDGVSLRSTEMEQNPDADQTPDAETDQTPEHVGVGSIRTRTRSRTPDADDGARVYWNGRGFEWLWAQAPDHWRSQKAGASRAWARRYPRDARWSREECKVRLRIALAWLLHDAEANGWGYDGFDATKLPPHLKDPGLWLANVTLDETPERDSLDSMLSLARQTSADGATA